MYPFEDDGDEECPTQVAHHDAEALYPAEWMQLVRHAHAQKRMLVLGPLAKVAPPLQDRKDGVFLYRASLDQITTVYSS